MPVLKSLIFTPVPARGDDPADNRRSKLVARLEEQKVLLKNPAYVRITQRWTGKGAERRQVDKQQRVRPWWRTDAKGGVVMSVYYGTKPVEFEKGKAAIAVGPKEKLPAVIDALIKAVSEGELDDLIARMGKPVGGPKSSRAA